MLSCLHTCHRWFKEKSETQNGQALDDAIIITMIRTKLGQIKTCSEDRLNEIY